VSGPIMSDLVATLRETVTLSVVAPDGGLDVVHQVDAPAQLRPHSWVGQRFPLHASASGKVLLATYDDDRLAHFLDEPLTRFTPSTITSAEALREELGHVREQRCGEGTSRRRFSRSSAARAADAPGRLQLDGDEQRAVLGRAGNGLADDLEDAAQPLVEALSLQV
jgi:DNA-binding IclR family transcriptional regulator